jgi:hypothetical protein
MPNEVAEESAAFEGILRIMLTAVPFLFYVTATSSRPDDNKMAMAHEALSQMQKSASACVQCLQRVKANAVVAFVHYCTATYALTLDDLAATERHLELGATALLGEKDGMVP